MEAQIVAVQIEPFVLGIIQCCVALQQSDDPCEVVVGESCGEFA